MPTFVTPYSGSAELTAGNGLDVVDAGLWRYSQAGYNDRATFGLSLAHPNPTSGGLLHLRAQNWSIAAIGNELTAYTDPATGIVYTAEQCRIAVSGAWVVLRQPNSNSFNSIGVDYTGTTVTDLGDRQMSPYLLSYTSPPATYIIQGSAVDGGAVDTFSTRVFSCEITESTASANSNREYQSNSIVRPVWAYTYSKSWQTAV
jgi:hypothetical protein